MARGASQLRGALESEDTEVMVAALRSIGVRIERRESGRTLLIEPPESSREAATDCRAEAVELYIANSGTSVRFLTAALSALGGRYRLIGVPRMHERPIGDLVDAIGEVLDGEIRTESKGGCPPVQIDSRGWKGSELHVAGSVSSQFLSGLMMAAPIASGDCDSKSTRIAVVGELVSRPYVDMTARVMRSFGASVDVQPGDIASGESLSVVVGGDRYRGTDYAIEPDASAASYFWAAAAISGGTVKVEGLTHDALQGDVGFCEVLERMGCKVDEDESGLSVTGGKLQGIDVDMNQISDTVQTLSVVALFADGPTRIRGVAHNRFKETDRIGDLACELRKLGATIDEHDDGLTIHSPGGALHGATLETYHDHRMAMSLALAGLRVPGVRILDPACTAKTYPEFFADLEYLRGVPHRWSGARSQPTDG
jgi:3-phosphoshikimate 1-carboxyvinyltransferase